MQGHKEDKVDKYPILEEAKKKAKKIRGAKGYTQYKTDQKDWELEMIKQKVQMRRHIYARIKAIYDKDLALLEEAEEEYSNKIYGKKGEETTK